jgi:hypothetical protein
MGWGVFWWYAEAVPTPGLPGQIWMNGRFGLFDQNGNLNDAASVFEEFLPTPGDFNRDGIVDEDDYTVWRDGLGTLYNETDYDDWKSHFGTGAGAGGAGSAGSAAPEPTAIGLGLVAVTLIGWRSRRSRLHRIGPSRSRPAA